ncbi:copper resistance protein CopC [Microbacterium sp. SSW1-49]|uniref:Copper resistance protein CopC n=1 Tax=Microbacterium croceum TaxID=2851645 RepID=A0ABT0FGM0_9MICO|nr:copper resistance CopC family protein [Microbacterium croceum]MCK2037200.1 copper resistance protein CopC [Microbacterium croceum]
MQTTARRFPAVPVALAATLLAAFLVLFSPLAASAHDALVSSSPAADSTVETLPDELTLTFSAKLITGEGATEVVVTDAEGNSVTDGEPTVDGAIVTQPLKAEAAAGEYHVIWKVVSSDGHPTSEEFFFTVTASSLPAPDATPTTAPATAAPSPESTSTPEATTTPAPDADAPSSASAWIWALSIGGIAAIAALLVWWTVRARKNASATDSDPSTGR